MDYVSGTELNRTLPTMQNQPAPLRRERDTWTAARSTAGTGRRETPSSPYVTPAVACGGDPRRPRRRRRGVWRSCTSHTSGGRWREPSWLTSSWRRPTTPSTGTEGFLREPQTI